MSFSPGIGLGGVHKDICSTVDKSPFFLDCLCQTKDVCDLLVDYGLLCMPILFHCKTRTL